MNKDYEFVSEKPIKVLIVDDEEAILELLEYNLAKHGYNIEVCNNGIDAIIKAREFVPDIILLDIMMPKQDGIETCKQLREIPHLSETLILFLTARSEEYSEVAAFEMGADDYITKPIKPRALLSRIQALVRRKMSTYDNDDILERGDLIINKASYIVQKGNQEIVLPRKEFELLFQLARKPNKVYGREELLARIWGTDVYVLARTVDVHIRKVREKIGDDYIATVKGVGYKFIDPNKS